MNIIKRGKITSRCTMTLTAALIGALCYAGPALAQHDHQDLLIGSDADGSGSLVLDYPFDEVPVVRVTDSGFAGLFSSTDPGFMPAEDEPAESVFELDIPTTVGFEITDIDSGVTVKIGATDLDFVGASELIGTHDNADPDLSGLHQHPTFEVALDVPDNKTFAEGRVSFRVFDNGGGYGDSEIHSLVLSNGYLGDGEENLKCLSAVGKEQRKLMGDRYKRLAKCMDKALAAEESGNNTSALKLCDLDSSNEKSLVSKLSAGHAKSIVKIEKKCGTLSDMSEPFTESQVWTHLGMGACRMEEMIGATYLNAREELAGLFAEQFGDGTCAGTCSGGPNPGAACTDDEECSWEEAVGEAFGCLTNSNGEGHEEE